MDKHTKYSTGYSKRSLVDKLGIKPGFRLIFINSPVELGRLLSPLPSDIHLTLQLSSDFDFIHYFYTSKNELSETFPTLKKHLKPTGMLWVSWPKGSSKTKTDLNENVIREIGLNNGLVDVKVIAVDDIWSGLKFVFRLKDRA